MENKTVKFTKERNSFGLTSRDMQTILQIFQRHSEVRMVYIYGSRVKGCYKTGSDIDLAVMNGDVDGKVLMQLKADFDESSLPYRVDITDFSSLRQPELVSHIQRLGKPFFIRTEE